MTRQLVAIGVSIGVIKFDGNNKASKDTCSRGKKSRRASVWPRAKGSVWPRAKGIGSNGIDSTAFKGDIRGAFKNPKAREKVILFIVPGICKITIGKSIDVKADGVFGAEITTRTDASVCKSSTRASCYVLRQLIARLPIESVCRSLNSQRSGCYRYFYIGLVHFRINLIGGNSGPVAEAQLQSLDYKGEGLCR